MIVKCGKSLAEKENMQLTPNSVSNSQLPPIEDRGTGWLAQVFLFFGIAALCLGFFAYLFSGRDFQFSELPSIGTVMEVYGTVKKARMPVTEFPSSQRRLASGDQVRATVHIGEQIQTGEDSAVELLFYGGTTLQLAAGTVVNFEEVGDEVSLRLLMGRAFLEIPAGIGQASGFIFRRADGKVLEAPEGKSLLLTLNSAERLEESLNVRSIEVSANDAETRAMNLRFLAHGEEINHQHTALVTPVEDSEKVFTGLKKSKIGVPSPSYPSNDDDFHVSNLAMPFVWTPLSQNSAGKPEKPSEQMSAEIGRENDPVVGYELSIRPAFGYSADDGARKRQVIRSGSAELPVSKVGGGGVFLWSVRGVTQSGQRGPASSTRWVELRFPRILVAPRLMKPKVD